MDKESEAIKKVLEAIQNKIKSLTDDETKIYSLGRMVLGRNDPAVMELNNCIWDEIYEECKGLDKI